MPETQPNHTRRNLIILTAVILTIIAAFILLIDWENVFRILEKVNTWLLAAASAALIVGLLFFALRWRVLMENKPHLGLTFHASNIGFAGNILIPFRGGEALRIFVMGRSGQVSYTTATASFVVERSFEQLMRLLALVTAVIIGVGIKITPITIISGLGFIALLIAGAYWLINHREAIVRKGPSHLARLPRVSEESAPTQPGIFHASIVVPLTAVGFDVGALTAYAVILHLLEMFWMIGLAGLGLLRIGLSPRQLVSGANE